MNEQTGYAYQDLLNISNAFVNNLSLTGNDPNSVPFIDAGQNLADYVLTNGQLLIGNTSNAPVANSLSGTANITITNGPGTITIDTVQPITPSDNPTFNSVTISTLAGPAPVRVTSAHVLTTGNTSLTTEVTGILPIANGGTNSSTPLTNGKLIVSAGNQIVEGTSSTSPSFTDLTISALNTDQLIATDLLKKLISVTITNANGTNLTYTGGIIAASMTQNLTTSGTPTFAAETLTNTSNQLVLGTTRTVTITAPTPATASRTHTIPDITGNGTFAFLQGTQTFTGSKSFASTLLANTDATVDIGSTAIKSGDLYLAKNSGIIYLGQGFRTANRAEMFINCNGDSVSEIFFGRDARTDANTKWGISSRAAADDNELRIYRCPFMAGGSTFQPVLTFGGSTAQSNFVITTDSSSSTTGAVIIAGGLGVAKNLYVGSNVNVSGLTATRLAATDSSKSIQSVTITNNNANGTNNSLSFSGSTLTLNHQ